jgi:hypothetical protein
MANPGWETCFGGSVNLINRRYQRMTHRWAGYGDSTQTDNGNDAIEFDEPRSTGLNQLDLVFLMGALVPDYIGGDSGLIPSTITFNVYNPATQPVVDPGNGGIS